LYAVEKWSHCVNISSITLELKLELKFYDDSEIKQLPRIWHNMRSNNV